MQGPHLRKYGVATTINFDLFEVDGVNFRIDASHAAGDTQISKDEGAQANTGSGFVDEGDFYSIALTGPEMQAARIVLRIIDQTATKVWLDKSVSIETYGNAAAQHAFDLDTATQNINVSTISANAITAAAINAAAITAAKFAAGAIDAAAIANGAIDTATFAAGAIDNAAFNVTETLTANPDSGGIVAASFGAGAIDAAAIASGAIDADALAGDVQAKIIGTVTGTADSGTATTIVDAERTEATTDYWQHSAVKMTSGPNIGQIRRITAFNAGTDTISVAPAFKSAVGTGNTYTILSILADGLRPTTEGNEALDVTAGGNAAIDWGNVENQATGVDLSGTDFQLVDTCTANTDQRGTDSALLAASAPTNFSDMAITVTTGLVDITQTAADKVWSSATRTLTAFSTALALSVWDVLESAIVTASSIGLKVKNNLDAAITTRATPAQVNTEVVDVINTDATGEPGQAAPPASTGLRTKIDWLYKVFRNKKEQTTTEWRLYNDAGTIIDSKAGVSDAASIATKDEVISGP